MRLHLLEKTPCPEYKHSAKKTLKTLAYTMRGIMSEVQEPVW